MTDLLFAFSVFWGGKSEGEGDAWLAWLAIILLPLLSLVALYLARTFVKKI